MRGVRVLLSALALGVCAEEARAVEGPEPVPGQTRPAILIGNNWDGTTEIVDPDTFETLDRVNVIPDLEQRLNEFRLRPDRFGFFLAVRALIGEGNDQFNDDVFSSNDGSTLYVSRPSLADVVAIDLASKQIKWRAPVDGYRSDHMAINAAGTRLLVSASTGNVVHELDTATGERTRSFPSGDSPHENVFSKDGKTIYHASIGRVYLPTDRPTVIDSTSKGGEYFQVVDNDTMEVRKRIDMSQKMAEAGYPNFSAAVRPMALSPDERFVYFQLSFFHGFVEYDLVEDKVKRIARMPISDAASRLLPEQYLLDSAQHGLALEPRGRKFCVAGTMSDYGAIVDRETFKPTVLDAGSKPYWSTNSADGRYCYISSSGDDTVAVISYDTEQIVHKIPVGRHPQRVRNGVVRIADYAQGAYGERFTLGTFRRQRVMRFRRAGRNIGCRAENAQRLRLVRCRVDLMARGKRIGGGERFGTDERSFKVRVKLTPEGRRIVRRAGRVKARVVARGVDSTGRTGRASDRLTVVR